MLTAAGLHAVWLPACAVHQAGATNTSSTAHFRGSRACGRPLRRTIAAAESGGAAPHFGADAPHFGATSSSNRAPNFSVGTGDSDTASLDDEAPHFGAGAPRPCDARPQQERSEADSPELARWQRKRLEAAYQAGKRSISVKQLVGDTKLDRKTVLAWLKERALREGPDEEEDAGSPFAADTTEQAINSSDGGHHEGSPEAMPPASTANMSFAERQAAPGGDFARKRMKRSTEMTLEKVFDRYRWPPDDMIAGICELHREMSPGRVKLWFEERRRSEPQSQGQGRRRQ